MLLVTAADFQQNFGRYQEIASREPVAVTRDGLESCILLSTEEYHRLTRHDRTVLGIEDFTDADAEAVRSAQPSAHSAAYDIELNTEA